MNHNCFMFFKPPLDRQTWRVSLCNVELNLLLLYSCVFLMKMLVIIRGLTFSKKLIFMLKPKINPSIKYFVFDLKLLKLSSHNKMNECQSLAWPIFRRKIFFKAVRIIRVWSVWHLHTKKSNSKEWRHIDWLKKFHWIIAVLDAQHMNSQVVCSPLPEYAWARIHLGEG